MPRHTDFDPVAVCERIQSGDGLAESELVRRFSESVTFMLKQRTRDESLAEDLHQDTFRIILERLRSARGISDPTRLSGFVHRTALNLCIDHARKVARRKTHTDGEIYAHVKDPGATQLSRVIEEERVGLVRDIIDNLTVPRDREILRRFYVLEQDKSQICNYFEMSPDNFDRVISRARTRFKEAVLKRMRDLSVQEI